MASKGTTIKICTTRLKAETDEVGKGQAHDQLMREVVKRAGGYGKNRCGGHATQLPKHKKKKPAFVCHGNPWV
jgi:hypothetical protein